MTHINGQLPLDHTNLWTQEQDSMQKFHHVTWTDPELSLERIKGFHRWSKIKNKGWERNHHHFCSTDMEIARHYRHQQRHLSERNVRKISAKFIIAKTSAKIFYLPQQKQILVGGAISPYLIGLHLFSLSFSLTFCLPLFSVFWKSFESSDFLSGSQNDN